MCVEQSWNDTVSGKLKKREKIILECGWKVDGCVGSNGAMLQTGEN